MTLPDIFSKEIADATVTRINRLTPQSQPKWGKMDVSQMLAHCNVTYEMVYTDKHPQPGAFTRWLLKAFIKNVVVGNKPYKHNTQTAPQFRIADARDFETEKRRLIGHIYQTQELGAKYFDGKASHSFGKLNEEEWNNMFYKHLDHHLTQFGV